MRLHVVGLPHTETTSDYNQCAYTAKVRKFATMMHRRGHEVFLYSAGDNEAECTEHVPVISKEEQFDLFENEPWWLAREWFGVDWNDNLPYWKTFNANVCHELHARLAPQDIICLITGWPQRSIVDCFPKIMSVEFGIGYEGVYAPFRVYESYAWMHCLYGKTGPSATDGRFYDTVIPNYFDIEEFPEHAKPQFGDKDFYLFMSRMTPRKGYEIAIEFTKRVHAKLIVAGTGGDRPLHDHVEYVGYADAETRGWLLSHATGLLCPTLYLEPFGGVVVESMLCGTPVLTTDFGAFTETVRNGVDGFRCHNMADFERASWLLPFLNNDEIRLNARNRWSTETVGKMYDDYFERLTGLWGEGFYASA